MPPLPERPTTQSRVECDTSTCQTLVTSQVPDVLWKTCRRTFPSQYSPETRGFWGSGRGTRVSGLSVAGTLSDRRRLEVGVVLRYDRRTPLPYGVGPCSTSSVVPGLRKGSQ